MTSTLKNTPTGHLANRDLGLQLPVTVLQSGAGYYLGTIDEEGPVSRESEEYFETWEDAEQSLATGNWCQRTSY